MIIGTTTIGNSVDTLGLDIISIELRNAGFDVISVDESNAKDVDILLVSLYWIDQIIRYPQFLVLSKINPQKRKPIIIIGGSGCFNPYPLIDMFHYAVLGDGENVTVEAIRLIEQGDFSKLEQMPCVMTKEKILSGEKIKANFVEHIPTYHYVESRTNKVTRLEIARGCKMKCAFCQLTAIKPYVEIPPVILKQLIRTSPTKNIALFCPDRGSYSGYLNVEKWCLKYGKRNMGTDIRLESASRQAVASQIRFGLEGFSERERRYVKKPYSNSKVIDDIYHIFAEMRTPKDKPITVITMYMIIGLLGQSGIDYVEFAETLKALDERCSGVGHKCTIFLSHNDFNPYVHTVLGADKKDVETNHFALWKAAEPRLKNIVIADHGGSNPRPLRLMRLLVARGYKNSNVALYNASIQYNSSISARDDRAYQTITRLLRKCNIDIDTLINGGDAIKIASQFIPAKRILNKTL